VRDDAVAGNASIPAFMQGDAAVLLDVLAHEFKLPGALLKVGEVF